MRILRAAGYRTMPWKNGGGTTTEIAVSPADAGLDDFDWRISMARVEAGGPFSAFPGIDRTLCVLEGEGLTLDVAGLAPATLTGTSEPFSFPADAPTSATLPAGPITDLNVMTRRSRLRHRVERLDLADAVEIATDAALTLVLCHEGEVRLRQGTAAQTLGRLDMAVLVDGQAALRLDPAPRARLFVIRITAGQGVR